MSNYVTLYPTPALLWDAAREGVKPGWFDDSRVEGAQRTVIEFLHEMAMAKRGVRFCPSPKNIYASLKVKSPWEIKVAAVFQDPYTSLEHADGIALESHADEIPRSAAMFNQSMWKYKHFSNPQLLRCADYGRILQQGVLMINTTLTVEEGGASGSHATVWGSNGAVQKILSLVPPNSVAILFGRNARSIGSALRSRCKIEYCHPVARNDEFLSRDVLGEANEALVRLHMAPIVWTPGPAISSTSSTPAPSPAGR